jgi:hypothetical protein
MDDWALHAVDKLGSVATILLMGYLVITRKLIWYKDYNRIEAEKDEWKRLALRLLETTTKLANQTEVTASVLSQSAGKEESHETLP